MKTPTRIPHEHIPFLLRSAADLMSDEGTNPEYDRALITLTRRLLGLDPDDDADLRTTLRVLKGVMQ